MAGSTTEVPRQWIRTCGSRISLVNHTLVMGVLNVTPDSFSDGGRFLDPQRAFEHAQAMVAAGADIIDVGAESTRPGAQPLSAADEIQRLHPVLSLLGKHLKVPLSIDTQKASVAQVALDLGASLINDVSALRHDASMGSVVSRAKAGVILMHMQGTPDTMQQGCTYGDVVTDVKNFLRERVHMAQDYGISSDQIVIDPGIGFGKTTQQNLLLLQGLESLNELGYPLLVGVSNKSFIGTVLNRPVEDRTTGTAAVVAASVLHGAKIVRVHEVGVMKEVVQMVDAIISPQWN